MNLLSAIILPKLKQELLSLEPEMALFILNQIKGIAADIIHWAEEHVHHDLDGDGKIGDEEEP